MGSDWGTYRAACPSCKGDVEWFWFSDHYDNGGGMQCSGCKKEFHKYEELDIYFRTLEALRNEHR